MKTSRQHYKLTRRQRQLRYLGKRLLSVAAIAAVVTGLIVADRWGVFGRRPLPDTEKYHGKSFRVVKVVDGDTLDVGASDGRRPHTRVRLWGVDTPETVKPNTPMHHFGPEASRFTKDATLGRQVTLELDPRRTRCRYGRLLAYVILPDGRMLNRVLIREGYGYADPRFDHDYGAEFRRLQREAMRAGRGLWKSVRREDLPYYHRDLKLPKTTGGSRATRPAPATRR